jgi:Carboxypeptidase regulatory-like domain
MFPAVDSAAAHRALDYPQGEDVMANDESGNFRIAVPCEASWEGMAGDERVRHCSLCSLNVYNFAEMTRDEVRELLLRTEGRVCARLYRRADGTVLTRDCPKGLRAVRQRAFRAATALIAALLSLPSLAFGSTSGKPGLKTRGSKVTIEIERVATAQRAALTGVVRDQEGNPMPGVSISLWDEASKSAAAVVQTVTKVGGVFSIAGLSDGIYRVEITLPAYTPARMEHLELTSGQVTHANVALRLEAVTVTMGAMVSVLATTDSPGTTTITQDMLNKLPF